MACTPEQPLPRRLFRVHLPDGMHTGTAPPTSTPDDVTCRQRDDRPMAGTAPANLNSPNFRSPNFVLPTSVSQFSQLRSPNFCIPPSVSCCACCASCDCRACCASCACCARRPLPRPASTLRRRTQLADPTAPATFERLKPVTCCRERCASCERSLLLARRGSQCVARPACCFKSSGAAAYAAAEHKPSFG